MMRGKWNPRMKMICLKLNKPFCTEIFYCYYGEENANSDDLKEWEIVTDLKKIFRLESIEFRFYEISFFLA